jgi:hypothetical protein
MRGRIGGMEDEKLKQLREIADKINRAIAEATLAAAETQDKEIRSLVAESLTDLQRAWLILDERLRKK